jgi:hypothetical protein
LSGKSTDQDSGTEVPNGSAAATEANGGPAAAAVTDGAVTDGAGADPAEADGPVTSSAKEVFAAALEKKKAAGQARSAHLDGHGGVGGATASHKATRTFRRKSG